MDSETSGDARRNGIGHPRETKGFAPDRGGGQIIPRDRQDQLRLEHSPVPQLCGPLISELDAFMPLISSVFERSTVLPAIEPLSLRLPKDLLVLQPMQRHLDLEPVLLVPGLRCAIGSAEGCAVRLTKTDLLEPEHCVIEVVRRQTLLTEWTSETTWLNDRLVTEPRELVPGDRVSLGPFDFRIRLASAEELLYAKLVERDANDSSRVEDVLRLKRAIDQTGRDAQPDVDLFSDLLRETATSTDSESHERLSQHISKLLSDLQSQVLNLQEREADLSDQLRRHHEAEPRTASPGTLIPPAPLPSSVPPEFEQMLQLLQQEHAQLERERAEFAEEQARWHEPQLEWSQRLEELESQLTEFESQRSALMEEKSICRALAEELLRDKAKMEDWKARLQREEQELAARQSELDRLNREFFERPTVPLAPQPSTARPAHGVSSPNLIESVETKPSHNASPEFEATPIASRPVQTFLTLIAFGSSAFFLGTDLGNPDVILVIGWTTALVGAVSTVDLLLRRCLAASH